MWTSATAGRRRYRPEEKNTNPFAEANKVLYQGISMMQHMDSPDLDEKVRRCLHQAIAMVHGAVDRLNVLQGPDEHSMRL